MPELRVRSWLHLAHRGQLVTTYRQAVETLNNAIAPDLMESAEVHDALDLLYELADDNDQDDTTMKPFSGEDRRGD